MATAIDSNDPTITTINYDDPIEEDAKPSILQDEEEDENSAEIASMRARVLLMEAEAAKLRLMTAESISASGTTSDAMITDDEKEATDSRSVYVGNVDYAATPEEIQSHFSSCGAINRITILFDKFTGPKGYAYVEFADPSLVPHACLLNESMFRGRLLKVTPKRTNVPGLGTAARGRGRGRGRGGYRGGRGDYNSGYSPYSRPRGRGGYRGRGGPPVY